VSIPRNDGGTWSSSVAPVVHSGFFADARDASQAIIKIQAGAELGLPPVQAMTQINVIKGRITLSAGLMAALLKRAGYRLRVVWGKDPLCCTILVRDPHGEEVGDSSFSTEDAKQAGLSGANWQKYTRNMLYARAVSNAARWYAPEVLAGCYLPEELADAPQPRQPDPMPRGADPVLQPELVPLDPDVECHPGEGWQRSNRRLRAVMREAGVSNDEMKEVVRGRGEESSTALLAPELDEISDELTAGLTEEDQQWIDYTQACIADSSVEAVAEDARAVASTTWRRIFWWRICGAQLAEVAA